MKAITLVSFNDEKMI